MQRPSFNETWDRHGRRGGVSPELEPLARQLYEALLAEPLDPVAVREALERLLDFLASKAGRTDSNCTAFDSWLSLGEFEWPDLPGPVQDILGDMAGALHDTVSAPEIAANFECTPEQLLVRLRSAP